MKNFAYTMGAIFAAGLLLNMMASGKFGSTAQTLATNVTKGYGV